MIGGRVLDHTAIRDAASGETIYARVLIETAVTEGIVLAVPTAALTVAWARSPADARPFLDLLTDLPTVVVDELTLDAAMSAGILLAEGSTEGPVGAGDDVAAAHTVHSARARGWPVVTRNPRPLHLIDPELPVERLP